MYIYIWIFFMCILDNSNIIGNPCTAEQNPTFIQVLFPSFIYKVNECWLFLPKKCTHVHAVSMGTIMWAKQLELHWTLIVVWQLSLLASQSELRSSTVVSHLLSFIIGESWLLRGQHPAFFLHIHVWYSQCTNIHNAANIFGWNESQQWYWKYCFPHLCRHFWYDSTSIKRWIEI